jgi:hypothetical protein
MSNSYLDAKQYAMQLADRLAKKDLIDFFSEVHDQFYPDVDIGFMEYFLEIAEHEGEFVVEHTKLREYGVMTSIRSNDIKKKLDDLELVKDEDYLLRDISQQVPSGIKYSKHYHLTPEAFKKCLMRARRYTGQTVDPTIYVDYYLLLEKIFGLYREYQSLYQEKVISMKDDKIDSLIDEVKQQTATIQK